jgi:hypothetical protein
MYNKLFTKILDSSIWLESVHTRLVWLTLIAAMDEDGFCPFAAVGNLAARARVPLQACQKAIDVLEGPDRESGNPANDGRRIERVPGGWVVLNAQAHRDMVTRAVVQTQTRERVRKHRANKAGNAPVTVSNEKLTLSEAVSEADTETETVKNVDQDHRTDVRKSHKVLVKLAHQAITETESESEGIERTKELAARARIPYNTGAVIRAYEAALKQREKAS